MSLVSNPLNSEMKNETKYKPGDNDLESKFSGDLRLNYFTNMVRDTDACIIRSNVKNMIKLMKREFTPLQKGLKKTMISFPRN